MAVEVEIVSMETNSTSISTANSKADIKEKMPKPKCWDVSGVPFEGNASNIMLAAKSNATFAATDRIRIIFFVFITFIIQ